MTAPLLIVEDITVSYQTAPGSLWRQQRRVAVAGVSFTIAAGETLGLVGESGSGKSTIGRAILGRVPLEDGHVTFDGQDVSLLRNDALRNYRRLVQAVFQDPYASLNPRMSVRDIVAEPLLIHALHPGTERQNRVAQLLRQVGLPPDVADAYPAAISGGQRQRVGIARALALEPRLVIADEPVSALDVSVRAGIINLFRDLQRDTGTAFLFITHDLAVARYLSHQIVVLLAGRVVETGPASVVFAGPRHPYTQDLLAAIPMPDRPRHRPTARRAKSETAVRSVGCAFAPSCPRATSVCLKQVPPLLPQPDGRRVACWNLD